MVRYLLIILSLVLLSSCRSTEWWAEKCSEHVPTVIKTEIRIKDSMAIHTDTNWINYHVAADSLFMANKLYSVMDSLGKCKIQNASGTVQSNKIVIKYIVRNDSILIEAFTKPYDIKIAQLTFTIEHFKEMYQSYYEKQAPTACKKRSWFSYFYSWLAMGIIAFFIFTGIIRKLGYKLVFRIAWPPFALVKR